MRKITLLVAILFTFSMNAQLFFDDFQDLDFSDWTTLDEDGDGNIFRVADPTFAQDGVFVHLTSASWNITPLTPDNYAISPAIDVTGISGLFLTYSVGGQDPSFFSENYTVYVSTGNTVEDFMNDVITVSFNENIGDDPDAAVTLVPRTLDVSALDGATTLYIAFRHHDVTDQFVIHFDDVTLDSSVLGLDDNSIEGFSHFVDTNNNLQLSVNNGSLENLTLFNTIGQRVLSNTIDGNNNSLDLNHLPVGVYIAQVKVNGTTTAFRVIKK